MKRTFSLALGICLFLIAVNAFCGVTAKFDKSVFVIGESQSVDCTGTFTLLPGWSIVNVVKGSGGPFGNPAAKIDYTTTPGIFKVTKVKQESQNVDDGILIFILTDPSGSSEKESSGVQVKCSVTEHWFKEVSGKADLSERETKIGVRIKASPTKNPFGEPTAKLEVKTGGMDPMYTDIKLEYNPAKQEYSATEKIKPVLPDTEYTVISKHYSPEEIREKVDVKIHK
jgi:hypothetical protein